MKRLFCSFLILTLLAALLCGCTQESHRDRDSGDTEPQSQTPEDPENLLPSAGDIEAQLRLDAYPESSPLMQSIGAAVVFDDISVSEGQVTFTLTAPHFGDELIAWFDAQASIPQGALEAQVEQLLAGAPVTTELTLTYTRNGNGTILFSYTDEYLNAAGCGLREYYTCIYSEVLNQMGGDGNG